MTELLFSVTRQDFVFRTKRGSGKGGQHRNTRDTAVSCTHPPSGASGQAQDSRSQADNRLLAWRRCVMSDEFQTWLQVETGRRLLDDSVLQAHVDRAVDKWLSRPVVVEVGDGEGGWRPATPSELVEMSLVPQSAPGQAVRR